MNLATRVFNKKWFAIAWVVFLIVVFGRSILLIAGLRLYDRWRSTRAAV